MTIKSAIGLIVGWMIADAVREKRWKDLILLLMLTAAILFAEFK